MRLAEKNAIWLPFRHINPHKLYISRKLVVSAVEWRHLHVSAGQGQRLEGAEARVGWDGGWGRICRRPAMMLAFKPVDIGIKRKLLLLPLRKCPLQLPACYGAGTVTRERRRLFFARGIFRRSDFGRAAGPLAVHKTAQTIRRRKAQSLSRRMVPLAGPCHQRRASY